MDEIYPKDFWSVHFNELTELFGNRDSFVIWLGFHEKELPFGYGVEDVLRLRHNLMEKSKTFKHIVNSGSVGCNGNGL